MNQIDKSLHYLNELKKTIFQIELINYKESKIRDLYLLLDSLNKLNSIPINFLELYSKIGELDFGEDKISKIIRFTASIEKSKIEFDDEYNLTLIKFKCQLDNIIILINKIIINEAYIKYYCMYLDTIEEDTIEEDTIDEDDGDTIDEDEGDTIDEDEEDTVEVGTTEGFTKFNIVENIENRAKTILNEDNAESNLEFVSFVKNILKNNKINSVDIKGLDNYTNAQNYFLVGEDIWSVDEDIWSELNNDITDIVCIIDTQTDINNINNIVKEMEEEILNLVIKFQPITREWDIASMLISSAKDDIVKHNKLYNFILDMKIMINQNQIDIYKKIIDKKTDDIITVLNYLLAELIDIDTKLR